ncbi:MAG: replication-associated recombination protein A [Oscillospiraceae bacterium]|nr:replication-associated recombination protein A [Oscillospiraceae bacterium]
MYRPLADRIRPDSIDDVFGQKHLLGENGILRRVILSGQIPNMIFFGPSGVGKTTVAEIIARHTSREFKKLNATTASISDIKDIVAGLDTFLTPNGVLLYIDEIQYFNKKQQQSLLEFMENGKLTIIASTTENPYFYVYSAILSRATVFEFKPIEPEDVRGAINRAMSKLRDEVELEDGVVEHISSACGGDVRKALNAIELLVESAERCEEKAVIRLEDARLVTQRSAMRADRDGDSHYDVISALQKSVRGSDPDAAVYYLARLLEAGDMLSACRRLLVIASEDVGLAYPQAISIVKSCVDSALQLGMPEARIPLAEAVILLATSPKSNSAICAIDSAISDIRNGLGGDIPAYLRDAHYSGAEKLGRGLTYKYPHSYPNHWVKQQYLPDEIKNKKYYEFGDNKVEKTTEKYWNEIKK